MDPSPSSSVSLEADPPHIIGGDLKIPSKDAYNNDNPTLYYYWVHVLELEKDKNSDKPRAIPRNNEERKMIGSLLEVQCGMMRCVSPCRATRPLAHRRLVATDFLFQSPFSGASSGTASTVMLLLPPRGLSNP